MIPAILQHNSGGVFFSGEDVAEFNQTYQQIKELNVESERSYLGSPMAYR
jgi:hypothetical protein